jgi:hypothetical protein
MFVESVSKLLITFILISFALKPLVYLALPLSILSSFLVGLIYIRKIKKANIIPSDNMDVKFPVKFAGTILLNKI